MKRTHVVIAVALLILAGLVILRQFASNGRTKAQSGSGRSERGPIAVQVAPAEYKMMRQEREFTGTVKAAYTYVVAAKVTGRLLSLSKE